MSTHFIHKYKHSHDIRRKFFKKLIISKEADIVAKFKDGVLLKTTNDKDYRISNRGRAIKNDRIKTSKTAGGAKPPASR